MTSCRSVAVLNAIYESARCRRETDEFSLSLVYVLQITLLEEVVS
jgi:hypothetical protein